MEALPIEWRLSTGTAAMCLLGNFQILLDTHFCLLAVEESLIQSKPGTFNTDQGTQFTSNAFTEKLVEKQIQISMDGRGRYLDNIFVEWLWRFVKYEDIFLKGYTKLPETHRGLSDYFSFYNNFRPHQALGYRTPSEVYYESKSKETLR